MGKTRTLSITSGKGGVGKTTMVSNLALSLSRQGQKVLVFDGDLGMANVDIFFGVRPAGNLGDVMSGKAAVRDILMEVSPGVHLLPGGNGLPELSAMNNFQRRALLEAVSDLPHDFDVMLIDTAPGISDNVLYLNSAADEVMILVTPDPASFADAYALIKVLNLRHKTPRFAVVCNQVRDEGDGFALFRRFQDVVTRFLEVGLDYWGSVPMDPALRRSNQMQSLILRQEPRAVSSVAIQAVAAKIGGISARDEIKGGLQMFWRQVAGVA